MDKIIHISNWDGGNTREPKFGVIENKNNRIGKNDDRSLCDVSLKDTEWTSYIERLQWEQNTLFDYLKDIQRKKFLVINYAVGIFPFIVSAIIAAFSYKIAGSAERSGVLVGFFLTILMAAGASNMVAIKYIAAFKANAILLIRQIICLRQALDSVTYHLIEGALPTKIDALRNNTTKYWEVFGRHRKLPIGNNGYRSHYLDNYCESADETVVTFLYVISSMLLFSPSFFMVVKGNEHILKQDTFYVALFTAPLPIIIYEIVLFIGLILLLASLFLFIKDTSKKITIPLPVEEGSEQNKALNESENFPPSAEELTPPRGLKDKKVKCKNDIDYGPSKTVILLSLLPILIFLYLCGVGYFQIQEGNRVILAMMSIFGSLTAIYAFKIIYADSFNRISKAAVTKQT